MNINDEKNLSEISHDEKNDSVQAEKDFQNTDSGIVSVNERGDQEDGMGKKIAFIVVIAVILIIGAVFGYNKFSGSKDAAEAAEAAKNAPDPDLNSSNKRRDFASTDPMPPTTAEANANADFKSMSACNDQSVPKQAVDPNGSPILRNGMHVFVCNDGQQILKQPENTVATQQQAPVAVQPQNQQYGQYGQFQAQQAPQPSRYSGAIFVNERSGGLSGFGGSVANAGSNLDARTQQAYNQVAGIVRHAEAQNAAQNSSNSGGGFGALASGFRGGNNSNSSFDDEEDMPIQATRATTNMAQLSANHAQARFIGDRNFLLAKGRVIKCNLSTKVVSEIGGMASCVIPQPVYSDNGKVVLAEAGSEVLGEYKSISTQGQRRLHILWTRLKTPHGVIVDLDSPASDALGTAGVSGKVDNRWGSRIGAAFMLSLVQDAIAYGIAKETEGSNQQYVLQNTSESGKTMAEKVLESTINIKPTIFTKQGDVASIYVAKDIDFRGVYELKAK